ITLAILQPDGRDRLLDTAEAVRARGGEIVFDTNYRPALWRPPEAAGAMRRAMNAATLALPSIADLSMVFEHAGEDWSAFFDDDQSKEIVLRHSATRLQVRSHGSWRDFHLKPATAVVDTTAAGDSFNAGYLAARLMGRSIDDAVSEAHALAAAVIAHPGAVIPRDQMPAQPQV
ncbi:MAG: PfkB family carbohydrate kinase, partial [Pseudomonadota bacterium]